MERVNKGMTKWITEDFNNRSWKHRQVIKDIYFRENKDIKQKSTKSKHKDSKKKNCTINWNVLVIPTNETTSCPTDHLLRGVSLFEKLPLTSDHSSVHLQLD